MRSHATWPVVVKRLLRLQDGGHGKLGTVVGFRKQDGNIIGEAPPSLPEMCAIVKWDYSKKFFYAIGRNREYHLAAAPDGGAITEAGLKVTADNIMLGARISRGPDWSHGDQDGGVGRLGIVLDWTRGDGTEFGNFSGGRYKLAARVQWDTGHADFYRIGKGGLYDLQFGDISRGSQARRRWKRVITFVRCAVTIKLKGRDHMLLFQPPLPPFKPQLLQGSPACGLRVGWKPPITRQDVVAYEVNYGKRYIGRWHVPPDGDVVPTNNFVIRDLVPTKAVVVRVRARNCNGWSDWSENSEAMTPTVHDESTAGDVSSNRAPSVPNASTSHPDHTVSAGPGDVRRAAFQVSMYITEPSLKQVCQ